MCDWIGRVLAEKVVFGKQKLPDVDNCVVLDAIYLMDVFFPEKPLLP